MATQTQTIASRVTGYVSVSGEWRLQARPGSGEFLVSQRNAMLCRVDRQSGVIYVWDKKGMCEVPIKIQELLALKTDVQYNHGVGEAASVLPITP